MNERIEGVSTPGGKQQVHWWMITVIKELLESSREKMQHQDLKS